MLCRITRAKEHLYLTCSKQRTIFGSTSYNPVSRFLKEIPEDLLEGYKEAFGEEDNNKIKCLKIQIIHGLMEVKIMEI